MKVSDSSAGGEAGQFHTTRWTLVMACAQQSPTGQAALAALCQVYWYPLYTFARRRGHSPHDAQDLTRGFFLHLLEHRALSQVDRLRGKFQSFLLACFQNYLSVEAQRAHAHKRGGQHQVVSLDLENAENRRRLEPADHLTNSATTDQLQIQEQSFGESKTNQTTPRVSASEADREPAERDQMARGTTAARRIPGGFSLKSAEEPPTVSLELEVARWYAPQA